MKANKNMHEKSLDVVGIGNAIVDVVTTCDDAFLIKHDMEKGAMTLIDEARADTIYDDMGPGTQTSGGSVANSIAGIGSFGGKAGYIGKVRDDALGDFFAHDLRSLGVDFRNLPATDGEGTARCLVFTTPDAERTMNTYLGIAGGLTSADLQPDLIRAGKIMYLEGYLFDRDDAKQAFYEAAKIAREAGSKVAITLSDGFCVDRHREDFLDFIQTSADILLANEEEICKLYQTDSFDTALQQVHQHGYLAALTRGEKGVVITQNSDVHIVDAFPVDNVVDTNGAGDQFAGGFLFALSQGRSLYDCGRAGAAAAAEVISHYGARPLTPLKDLDPGMSD